MTARRPPRFEGVVIEFDDHAGFGVIEAGGPPAGSGGPGRRRFWFHCTQIEDGSRHAEPGRTVTFRVIPGHHGRWEAAEVA